MFFDTKFKSIQYIYTNFLTFVLFLLSPQVIYISFFDVHTHSYMMSRYDVGFFCLHNTIIEINV